MVSVGLVLVLDLDFEWIRSANPEEGSIVGVDPFDSVEVKEEARPAIEPNPPADPNFFFVPVLVSESDVFFLNESPV
jgi:hypothetical protein